LAKCQQATPTARLISAGCRLRFAKGMRELMLDHEGSLVLDLLEDVRELLAMRCYKSIKDGCSDLAEVSAQVLVITAIGDGKAGRHVNQQFVNDQTIGAKGDKLMHRQAAVVAQLMRFRDAGRNVLAAEYRRKRQILARQAGLQTRVPGPVFGR